MNSILFLLITLAVALNTYATVVLVRSPRYDRAQKWRQCGLIWLLPVIGAILVWSLAHDAKAPMFSAGFGSGDSSGFGDGLIGADSCSSNDAGGSDGCGGGDGGGGGD